MVPRRFFEAFYLITPVFVALDALYGIPARAAGIPDPAWRFVYYALLVACWVVCRWWPQGAPVVGLCESSINLLLLLLSVLLPIWGASDRFLAGDPVGPLYGPGTWWNFAISGPMLILSIKSSEKAILDRRLPTQARAGSPRP